MNKITGKFCELLPFSSQYIRDIYNIEIDLNRLTYFSENMKLISLEKYIDYFDKQLKNHYHIFFMVKKRSTGEVIGYLYTYNYNPSNGYIYMSISSDENINSLYAIAEAGILFINYLFSRYSLRKIYAEVYGFNLKSRHIVENTGFSLEGELKKHRYYNGQYHSLLTYALYKDFFLKQKKIKMILNRKVVD